MRTTITLDPDVAELVQRSMRDRDLGFRQVVNDSLRQALAPRASVRIRTPTASMGDPRVDLTRALELSGQMEDEETARRLAGHI